MNISERMDTGDILLQRSLPIAADDTGGSLHDKLSRLGAEALRDAIVLLKKGELVARPQNEDEATYAPIIKKEDGRIDWTADAVSIERRMRAFTPWPSVYTTLNGKLLKIFKARVETQAFPSTLPCGAVVEVSPVHLLVETGRDRLSLQEVQLEGKKRMYIEEFLRGHGIQRGLVFGS
jgi:methionyl-tRNA formyltransferase